MASTPLAAVAMEKPCPFKLRRSNPSKCLLSSTSSIFLPIHRQGGGPCAELPESSTNNAVSIVIPHQSWAFPLGPSHRHHYSRFCWKFEIRIGNPKQLRNLKC